MRPFDDISNVHARRWDAAKIAMENAVEAQSRDPKDHPPPRDGFEFFKHPSRVEVENQVQAIMRQYEKLTYHQASQLNIYRATALISSMASNTSGGGSYRAYCVKIGVAF